MGDAEYIGAALAIFVLLVYKLWVLRRAPLDRKPAIRPICAVCATGFFNWLFAAPVIAVHVDRAMRIPNLSTLLVGCFGTATVCFISMMLLYWHYPRERAWRASRWPLCGYGLAAAVMIVLFVVGPAVPEYGVFDFPTAVATVPYLGAYSVIQLTTWAIGLGHAAVLYRRFARETPDGQPWLSRGLTTIAIGLTLLLCNLLILLCAVVVRWFGGDLTYWSTAVAPTINAAGGIIGVLGASIIPLATRAKSIQEFVNRANATFRDHRALAPLWRALRGVDPGMVHTPATVREWASIEARLFWRIIEINDWLYQLRPYSDSALVSAVIDAVVEQRRHLGDDESAEAALALVEAVLIRAALHDEAGVGRTNASSLGAADSPDQARNAFVRERARLVATARALTTSAADEILGVVVAR
ncbi:MAG: hypothetical protein JOZ47_06020 [Kutzneria sp.]|nr:hypothetical protein [Kutzneria sp.]